MSISVNENNIEHAADYIAKNIVVDETHSSFEIVLRNGDCFKAQVNLPGKHNVYNALSAFALCKEIGIDSNIILSALKSFEGVGRRFERVLVENKKVVIDDYAHHPSEVINCLGTARRAFHNREVVAVFEPHRYTRTQQCWDQFLHCFNDVDRVYILPIYPASESPIPGISTENLVRDINKLHPDHAVAVSSFDTTLDAIMEDLTDKAVVCMGPEKIGREISLWVKSRK